MQCIIIYHSCVATHFLRECIQSHLLITWRYYPLPVDYFSIYLGGEKHDQVIKRALLGKGEV